MSGPVCPKCGCPFLKGLDDPTLGKAPAQCEFCDWKGDLADRPRRILHPETLRRWSEKVEQKRKGLLFILTIKASEKDNPHVIADIMDALHIHSISHQSTPEGILLINIEFAHRPDEDTLNRLKSLPGVLDVSIA